MSKCESNDFSLLWLILLIQGCMSCNEIDNISEKLKKIEIQNEILLAKENIQKENK